MRRVIAIILAVFITGGIYAQSPKAVFKGLEENDIAKNTARFEKISNKTREKMPEMCYLAEAALLNMPKQLGTNKLRGYEILSEHIEDIRNSANIEKSFHNLDITLEDVIKNIENESSNYLMSLDTERNYVIYISWAKRGGHPNISQIESRLEDLRYTHTLAANSIEDCDFFLATYPESKYRDAIDEHRTTLHYTEAIESNDEGIIERFIANYPTYKDTPKAKHHLQSLRYNRIFSEGANDVEQMKWFLKQYPDHEEYATLKQRMADIEFESLPATSEALSAFIAYYGEVAQRAEAQRRLHLARIAEYGSVRDFVEYIKSYGYDTSYSVMLRQIYNHSKRYIISTEINDVTLLRYAAEDGLVGYMDFDGNMVIEPIYDAKQVTFGTGYYNRAMLSEFTPYRNIVALSLNGSWGVINDKGEQIVEHKYQALTIYNNQIFAVPDISAGESEYCDCEAYICDVYEPDGRFVKSGETTEWESMPDMRSFEFNDGTESGLYVTPKYCIIHTDDHSQEIVDREGNSYPTKWSVISGVTDNIAVVEVVAEDGSKQRHFANLDTQELIKECPYSIVHPMSCGRAAVWIDDSYGFIDENLELRIAPQFGFDFANKFNCGLMVVRSSDGVYGIINTDGEYLMTTNDTIEDVSVGCNDQYGQKGLFIISSDSKHSLIDTQGETIATIESEFTPEVVGIDLISTNATKRVRFNLEASSEN